jgi:predicted dehydrogenase
VRTKQDADVGRRTRRFDRDSLNGTGPGPHHLNGGTRAGVTHLAVVGLGYWGPNLLRALYEVEGVRVKYVCDLDRDRLEQAASRYPNTIATTELDRVLADPEVDGVVLATPVFTHFELASRCLSAGKHTLVEKPLAPSAAEADALLELAVERERVLMCGHTFVYSPAVRTVKNLLDAGELGELYFISSSRVNLGLHQRDVSVVWDLAPHDFSILLYWLEEQPNFVDAVGRDSVVPGIPDVAFIDLQFPSGVIAHVELSWLAPSKLRRTVLVGSEKMVVYDDSSSEPIRIFDSGVVYKNPETFGQYQLSYRTGDILSVKVDAAEPLVEELNDFVAAISTGRTPEASSELARDVVALTEAAESSLAKTAEGRQNGELAQRS